MRFPSFVACVLAGSAWACSSSDDAPPGGRMGVSGTSSGTSAAGGAGASHAEGGTGNTTTLGGRAGNGAANAGTTQGGTSGTSANSNGGTTNGGTAGQGDTAGTSSGASAATSGATSGGGRAGRNGRGNAGAMNGGNANAGAANGGAANGGSMNAGAAGMTSGAAGAPAGWTLSWSDEFDGPSGQSPDGAKWAYDVGGDGWGNDELEYYTNRTDNSATDGDGHLVITLKSETYMNRMYTSARLITQGKFTQAYGRFEARLKIPRGQGVWPAFWMLGADIDTNAWPNCGEIDIMENAGKEPAVNHGSLHGPGYSGGSPLTGTFTLKGGALADDFHLYAVEWETNTVRFYVDDNNYETRKNTDVPGGAKWVYDHPFFMILNIAIGGAFGGSPDSTTMLPQTMTVDYVRVYTKS